MQNWCSFQKESVEPEHFYKGFLGKTDFICQNDKVFAKNSKELESRAVYANIATLFH